MTSKETISNTWSYGKCWNFGILIKKNICSSWSELMKHPPWIEFKKLHKISDNQMFYIKKGFHGKPFENDEKDPASAEIMPFGNFKGKPMGDLSPKYIKWLVEQEWLDKWPTVALYARQRHKELESQKLSKEEIANALKLEK